MAEKKHAAEDGILLYYKYASIPDVSDLVRFFDSNCKFLSLTGRIRIASDGVNVTVGGKISSLEKHILMLKSIDLFEGTDFKLSSCHSPSNKRVAAECGFTSLSIRVVKELVTFSPHPFLKSPAISNAGRHLSAADFHSVLQNAAVVNGSGQSTSLILLDARNAYETRIGKFCAPNVKTLDPNIRQYSDLPAWIDNHSEQLRGNQILMYCTGGIRCEMASAYIRLKGEGYENVFQLYGGIQRYMEQFPEGGFFKGKNFVFDHRISVGSFDSDVLGSCLLCASPFDDYFARCRCKHCRMLVLVCNSCQANGSSVYICELCEKYGRGSISVENDCIHPKSTGESGACEHESSYQPNQVTLSHDYKDGSIFPRKLRILCLHGFRQNASSFKGRTASLAKKLKKMAELVFVDAPHELPFIYRQRPDQLNNGSSESTQPTGNLSDGLQDRPPPGDACKKRFAWLIDLQFNYSDGTDWMMAEKSFDPMQYQKQGAGFDESYSFLKTFLSQMGPFDGVLGFSQGAAMAALFCAQQEREESVQRFRFAILCSGFSLITTKPLRGVINCPSLHIFGNGCTKKDKQIARDASMELVGLFDQGSSFVIEHESGHIIPSQPPYIDQIKDFLCRFL